MTEFHPTMTSLTSESVARNGILLVQKSATAEFDRVFVYDCFRIFFTLNGPAAPANLVDSNNNGVPDYIEKLALKFHISRILLNEGLLLKDPLKEGILYDNGPPKFIDILLQDIPFEHGIASERVYSNPHAIFVGTPFQGKSLRIKVHRNLIPQTKTPIHELFHLYQFNYCRFNNMWFMEGLARWSQSMLTKGTGGEKKLPATTAELLELLNKLHDAEFFWNRLSSLCDKTGTFNVPEVLRRNGEIVNNRRPGTKFIRNVLENSAVEMIAMQMEQKTRKINGIDYWAEIEKKSPNNNKYILKAVIDAVRMNCSHENEEIKKIIQAAMPIINSSPSDWNNPEIQRFLGTIKKCFPDLVLSDSGGLLYSHCFDVYTKTFSHSTLALTEPSLTDEDIDSLRVLKHINGQLVIKDIQIHSLAGLDNLESAYSIHLEGLKNLTGIAGLNSILRVSYAIHIADNPALQSISGFTGLVHAGAIQIDQNPELVEIVGFPMLERIRQGSLEITGSPALKKIKGFRRLTEIKKTLLLSNCKKIKDVSFLSALKRAKNVEISLMNLSDGEPLRNLFSHSPHFWGYIKITSTRISSVAFMRGLKTAGSSFYLHKNRLVDLQGLEELERVGATFSFSLNELVDISQLSHLTEVNGLLNASSNNLSRLKGLENLRKVKTVNWNGTLLNLALNGNKKLTDISALANLRANRDHIIMNVDPGAPYQVKPKKHSAFCANSFQITELPGKVNRTKSYVCEAEEHDTISILFSAVQLGWQAALYKHEWLAPHFIQFKDVDKILQYCKKQYIEYILPVDMVSHFFVAENQEKLRKYNLHFLVNTKEVMRKCSNKKIFYEFMMKNDFGDYVPLHYASADHVDLPCIIKSSIGSGGRGQKIINDKEDVISFQENEIVTQYIVGNFEFATNILFYNGEVICNNTHKKTCIKDMYILGQEDEDTIVNEKYSTPFLDIFKKILTSLNYIGICCIDYKIVDNKPKIFEINARIGFTSVQAEFSADLKRMIGHYLEYSQRG